MSLQDNGSWESTPEDSTAKATSDVQTSSLSETASMQWLMPLTPEQNAICYTQRQNGRRKRLHKKAYNHAVIPLKLVDEDPSKCLAVLCSTFKKMQLNDWITVRLTRRDCFRSMPIEFGQDDETSDSTPLWSDEPEFKILQLIRGVLSKQVYVRTDRFLVIAISQLRPYYSNRVSPKLCFPSFVSVLKAVGMEDDPLALYYDLSGDTERGRASNMPEFISEGLSMWEKEVGRGQLGLEILEWVDDDVTADHDNPVNLDSSQARNEAAIIKWQKKQDDAWEAYNPPIEQWCLTLTDHPDHIGESEGEEYQEVHLDEPTLLEGLAESLEISCCNEEGKKNEATTSDISTFAPDCEDLFEKESVSDGSRSRTVSHGSSTPEDIPVSPSQEISDLVGQECHPEVLGMRCRSISPRDTSLPMDTSPPGHSPKKSPDLLISALEYATLNLPISSCFSTFDEYQPSKFADDSLEARTNFAEAMDGLQETNITPGVSNQVEGGLEVSKSNPSVHDLKSTPTCPTDVDAALTASDSDVASMVDSSTDTVLTLPSPSPTSTIARRHKQATSSKSWSRRRLRSADFKPRFRYARRFSTKREYESEGYENSDMYYGLDSHMDKGRVVERRIGKIEMLFRSSHRIQRSFCQKWIAHKSHRASRITMNYSLVRATKVVHHVKRKGKPLLGGTTMVNIAEKSSTLFDASKDVGVVHGSIENTTSIKAIELIPASTPMAQESSATKVIISITKKGLPLSPPDRSDNIIIRPSPSGAFTTDSIKKEVKKLGKLKEKYATLGRKSKAPTAAELKGIADDMALAAEAHAKQLRAAERLHAAHKKSEQLYACGYAGTALVIGGLAAAAAFWE